jgi:hypothetical protein
VPDVSPVTTRAARRSLLPSIATAACLLVVTPACGASEPDGEPQVTVDDGPRVADPRFDGVFEITELAVDGSPVSLVEGPTLEIETTFGGLTVRPGCNTHLGSFTLADDGVASFTVTGGSDLGCDDLGPQEQAVLAALAAVDTWTEIDGGFRFDGPGASITVQGPGGG